MERVIKIGSRKSRLALEQTQYVADLLKKHNPDIQVEIVPMSTKGDRILDRTLDKIGGKGLFVKEIDQALLEGKIDAAVHSLKDMTMDDVPGIVTVAYTERVDPRDVLVIGKGEKKYSESDEFVIGTSSSRRGCQLKKLYPKAKIVPVRGNLQTRLKKMEEGCADALVLAAAGLKRLGQEGLISKYFEAEEMVPAAGQGILAVQVREEENIDVFRCLSSWPSLLCACAERAFTKTLNGGCQAPVGAYARWEGGSFVLDGFFEQEQNAKRDFVSLPEKLISREESGLTKERKQEMIKQCQKAGEDLAKKMLANESFRAGTVWLAGAGPGSVGLLTLRTRQLIEEADLIAYDALVSEEILSCIPRSKETVSVGKRAGAHSVSQKEINELLVREALKGKNILRLKGGDPFLFGRGAEELESLVRFHIHYEVVPGVPSPLSALAYSGIPATHRDLTSSVHIIAGHEREGGTSRIDYEALVKTGGTLLFLMGLGRIAEITGNLIRAGMNPDTPAAVVSCATTYAHRCITASLSDISTRVREKSVIAPAVICVGDVCALAGQFAWKHLRPLDNRLYITTRPSGKNSILADGLRRMGAQVIELPAIDLRPENKNELFRQAFGQICLKEEGQCWIVFTSPAGVDFFFKELEKQNIDIRSLFTAKREIKFGVIGSATGRALSSRGIRPDLMPDVYTTDSMAEKLSAEADKGADIYMMRAAIGAKEILPALEKKGFSVFDIPLYDTLPTEEPSWIDRVRDLIAGKKVDGVTFTSASTVDYFAAMLGKEFVSRHKDRIRGYFIGDKTAEAAYRWGICGKVSDRAAIASLIDCIVEEGTQCFDISEKE